MSSHIESVLMHTAIQVRLCPGELLHTLAVTGLLVFIVETQKKLDCFADKANLGWTDLPTKPTKGGLICRQSQQRVENPFKSIYGLQ